MRFAARSVLFAILTFGVLSACGGRHTQRSEAAQRGSVVYARECSACHGAAGSGGPIGPSLRGKHGELEQIEQIVRDPEPPMPKLYPSRLSASDVRDVSAYVQSL